MFVMNTLKPDAKPPVDEYDDDTTPQQEKESPPADTTASRINEMHDMMIDIRQTSISLVLCFFDGKSNMKIEICRVREEVSSQNAILKTEMQQLRSQIEDLVSTLKGDKAKVQGSASPRTVLKPTMSLPSLKK
jgi:hypothetical protein